MNSVIKEKAPAILAEIEKSNSILLHCHPSPDPDSVGSVLAMKFALEQLGKKVTVIKGDSDIPEAFMHFPGAREIVKKSFSEINLAEFDLFIILDSGSPGMISYKSVPVFPLPLKTICIDHHKSNELYADENLIVTCSATALLLFYLFQEWKISFTHDIALNLFIGIYTDSGGFKYSPADHYIFEAAAQLSKVAPDFVEAIFTMENTRSKESIYFHALALNSIELFLNENIAMASVTADQLRSKNINPQQTNSDIPNVLKSVVGWNIGMIVVEQESGDIKVSMRSRDPDRFDVSILATALGGGGHRSAAGMRFKDAILSDVKKIIVNKAKELYNL